MEWKKEFIELSKNREDNLDKLKKICEEQKINSLYKYTSGGNYDIINLNNNQLKMKCPLYYNDPFDAQASFINEEVFYNEYASEHKDYIKDLSPDFVDRNILQIHNWLYPEYESFLKDLQVCCFSSIKDSILMWSHYSNEHRGFCIEYDLENLLGRYFPANPVIYSNEMPLITKDAKNLMDGIYQKAEEWSYENEWRIIFDKCGEEFVKMPTPKAIYFGCNISNDLKVSVIDICKRKEIECYQAKKSFFEYKLHFEKINLEV